MTKTCSMDEVMPNSFPMAAKAGATMVDDTGEMNVNDDTISTAAHFAGRLQLRGFSGSSGPDQVTYPVQQCESSVRQELENLPNLDLCLDFVSVLIPSWACLHFHFHDIHNVSHLK